MSRGSSFSPMRITSSTSNQWMPEGPVSRARRPLSPPEVRFTSITTSVWASHTVLFLLKCSHIYLMLGKGQWTKSSCYNRNRNFAWGCFPTKILQDLTHIHFVCFMVIGECFCMLRYEVPLPQQNGQLSAEGFRGQELSRVPTWHLH